MQTSFDLDKPTAPSQPLSVSELTARIKDRLQSEFSSVWVVGEISDLARPKSGHVYLTLKDQDAQIRAVIWRSVVSQLRFPLDDGTEVLCHGDLDVYPPRGTYQLIVRQVELRGEGALQRALRKLQDRLAAEGLFDPRHKKRLPRFPARLVVITSPTGAALRDFLQVAARRWPGTEILVVPTQVQGDGAARQIVSALAVANRLPQTPDVIVVTRGGGSIEDLWCFNEEVVVRAIFQSCVPVVSAVGHEIDVTLADLVADVRALTPSEAAERVLPSAADVAGGLRQLADRLRSRLRLQVESARGQLDSLRRRRVFLRPFDRVHDLTRTLDELELRLSRAASTRWKQARQRSDALAARLESLSPLAVLARGYSLTQRATDGELIGDANEVRTGDEIVTRLARGRIASVVQNCENDEDQGLLETPKTRHE
jgi:exodeoxyribonuclease VII large subunit